MNSDILIAASYLPGVTKAQIFGRNAAISNAAETVWTTGGTYAQLTAAVALEAVSGSVVKGAISATAGSVGKSADFIYTIPANTIGVLCPIRMSTYGASGALMAYLNTYTSAGVLRNIGGAAISLQGLGVQKGDFPLIDFGKGLRLEEKTLIELRAINSTGAGDLFAMADLFLFDRSLQKWVQ